VKSEGVADGRDGVVERALRDLHVPEHSPQFHAELREQLEWERFIVADVLWRRRGRRLTRRLGVAAAGALAAAAALIALAIGLPGGSPGAPAEATAAEVRAAVSRALSSAESLSGRLVAPGPETPQGASTEASWSFAITARGDFRLTGLTYPTDLAYDASSGVERYSDEAAFTVRTGIAPGWPDSDFPDWIVQRSLGSVATALARAGDPRVAEVEYRGRPAWRLRLPQEVVQTATGDASDLREITIDRATGIPVHDLYLLDGKTVNEWRLDGVRLDPPLAPDAFTLEPRPGQRVERLDDGFRRVALADVPGAVGYDPLVPSWLPDGFQLLEVAVADEARATGDGPDENPPSRGVVSLAYGRGLDLLVVSTRLIGPDPARWSDPIPVAEAKEEAEAVAFAGARGELRIDPAVVPHVWGLTERLVVTVAGNLDREELLAVARSLE
jgi:hypothetical protein